MINGVVLAPPIVYKATRVLFVSFAIIIMAILAHLEFVSNVLKLIK
jgi:hypothetical protein